MLFEHVGIAVTNRCTARCRMCCFECNPENDMVFDKKSLFSIISQLTQEGINKIGFTGGEPMLYPDLVFSAIEYANTQGASCSVTSNGFWAQDYANCIETLERFAKLNVRNLTASTDEYHQQYVDLQCIRNIIKANRHIGVRFHIAIGDSLDRVTAIDIIRELGRDIYVQNIVIYPFMPVGQGSTIPREKLTLVPYDPAWTCCYARHFSILYDGSTYPCCSQAVYKSKLSIGNIHQTQIKTLIHAYEDEGIFSTLLRQGLDYFVRIAIDDMKMQLPDAYTSPCHLCNILFSNEQFVDDLNPYIQAEYVEHIKRIIFCG